MSLLEELWAGLRDLLLYLACCAYLGPVLWALSPRG